jgi:hypothetical protein
MKCPGQDSRYWEGAAIFEVPCPGCGQPVEFFKDDASRTCRACGNRMRNPRIDFGCAAYCPHAAQCLGSLPEGVAKTVGQTLKERTAVAMKRFFGKDFKRIGHAVRVAHYAEEINRGEGGDPAVILITAYLHGLEGNEATPGNAAAAGTAAREILTGLQADPAVIAEVCDMLAWQHAPQQGNTTNFKVFHDADLSAHLEEGQQQAPLPAGQLEEIIGRRFLTGTGRRLAADILLKK